jgi:hypothetical protein
LGADGVAQKTIDFDGKRERGERETLGSIIIPSAAAGSEKQHMGSMVGGSGQWGKASKSRLGLRPNQVHKASLLWLSFSSQSYLGHIPSRCPHLP